MKSFLISVIMAAIIPAALQDLTGSIEGTIFDAYSGAPIRDIQVSLAGRHTGISDRDGHFKINKIPPGEYMVSVSQNRYVVPSGFSFSNNATIGTLKIQQREQIHDIQLEMVPSAVISGRIWKTDGSPALNARIQFLQYRYSETGDQKLIFVGPAPGVLTSNDRGEYRQWGFPPGNYFVLASLSNSEGSASVAGMVPTFYPNALSIGNATPVSVERGSDAQHIDVNLRDAQTSRVTVNLTLPEGVQTVTGKLQLVPDSVDLSGGDTDTCIIWTCVTAGRNQYTILNVMEGRYTILTSAYGLNDGREYDGHASVNIFGGGVEPITVFSYPVESFDLHGYVRFADSADNIKVKSAPIDLLSSTRQIHSPRTPSSTEGAEDFVIKHVPFGEYEIGANTPTGTYLSDVLQGNRSVLNDKLMIGPERPESLTVVLGRDGGTVRGIVQNIRGSAIGFARVVLIPMTRHLLLTQTSQADVSGRFKFENVEPGSYRLYSWLNVAPNAWESSEFVKKYDLQGTPLTVTSGQETSDLTVTRIVDDLSIH